MKLPNMLPLAGLMAVSSALAGDAVVYALGDYEDEESHATNIWCEQDLEDLPPRIRCRGTLGRRD